MGRAAKDTSSRDLGGSGRKRQARQSSSRFDWRDGMGHKTPTGCESLAAGVSGAQLQRKGCESLGPASLAWRRQACQASWLEHQQWRRSPHSPVAGGSKNLRDFRCLSSPLATACCAHQRSFRPRPRLDSLQHQDDSLEISLDGECMLLTVHEGQLIPARSLGRSIDVRRSHTGTKPSWSKLINIPAPCLNST